MSDLEKFLKGIPLNESLEEMARGEDVDATAPVPVLTGLKPDLGEIDDDDREHLRRLKSEPGWPIMLKLLDKEIQRREDSVKAISMADPLRNRDEVAEGWAYVSIMKTCKIAITILIDNEIAKLEASQRKQRVTQ